MVREAFLDRREAEKFYGSEKEHVMRLNLVRQENRYGDVFWLVLSGTINSPIDLADGEEVYEQNY